MPVVVNAVTCPLNSRLLFLINLNKKNFIPIFMNDEIKLLRSNNRVSNVRIIKLFMPHPPVFFFIFR